MTGRSSNSAARDLSSDKLLASLPETRWLVVLLVPLVVEKLVQTFVGPATVDETYYWLWGQHLAFSYYDHPPLLSWLLRLSAELLGWNRFALRAVSLASLCGSLAILWYWSRHYLPEKALRLFLAGCVVWLSTPMLMYLQTYSRQDPLLIFLGLATAHFFALFHQSLDGSQRQWRYYLAGCIALGLAGLTKYNAVFLGLGFAVFVVLSRKGRPLLRDWRLWVGAGIALAMQAPVLVWNAQNHWLSFGYNLYDRIGGNPAESSLRHIAIFLSISLLQLSPFLVVALFRFLTGKGPLRTPFNDIGRCVFLVSTAVFLLLCVKNWVPPYWNISAYVFALPVIVLFMTNRWQLVAHALYGMIVNTILVVATSTFPMHAVSGSHNRHADITFGWKEIAGIVAKEEKRLNPDMIMTTDYRTASLMAFHTKRLDIQKIGLRGDEFDVWFDPGAHKGQNALVLVDDYIPETELVTKVFRKVTPVRDIEITWFGYPIHTYRLVWAQDYSGAGPH